MEGPKGLAWGTADADTGRCSIRSDGSEANEKVEEGREERWGECSFSNLFTSTPPDAKKQVCGIFTQNGALFEMNSFVKVLCVYLEHDFSIKPRLEAVLFKKA